VIVESGGGFGGPLNFRRHRRSLRGVLNIDVAAPVNLWSGGARGAPYVTYVWPRATQIRDFSRVVPVEAQSEDDVIASVNGLPVALRRRVGPGTLIYLGSPLGPALWAGDMQARRWLNEVTH
jgi:hypothetical protein